METTLDISTAEKVREKVQELSPWPTSLYLKDGVLTREGVNMIKQSWYVDTMEDALGGLAGKRFLDIGANSGHLALEVALRGAGEVVAIEPHPVNYRRCEFVFSCRGLLGKTITLTKDTMESVSEKTHGRFDGVFFLGTIYHTEKPWDVMKSIGSVTDTIIVESRLAAAHEVNEKYQGLQYYRSVEAGGDQYSLHRVETGVIRKPTREALHQLIRRAGFGRVYQLMPIPELTEKYRNEENIAFFARRPAHKAPLVDQPYDR